MRDGPPTSTAGPSTGRTLLRAAVRVAWVRLRDAIRDLLPVFVVIGAFQLLVVRQPLPDLLGVLGGVVAVVAGLALFVHGLELALFPLGESMADALAAKGSLVWLLVFGFVLGFATTVAEPSLIAVAAEAAEVVGGVGLIGGGMPERDGFALQLRLTVAVSVGLAVALGVLRIAMGWPVHLVVIAGYAVVIALTLVAPAEVVGIAYDSGGVTTSTVTVPLVTALGVGLASAIRRRDPMIDGFGLIAFASLLPIIFVLGFGIVRFGLQGGA